MNFYYFVILLIIALSAVNCQPMGTVWQSARTRQCHSIQPNFASPSKRISEQKCDYYQWQMLERQRRVDKKCFRYGVINGAPSEPAEYPHMGALGWKSVYGNWTFLCGTFLISEDFTITAAHCKSARNDIILNRKPEIVRLGATNIKNSKIELPRDIGIKEIIPHPEYKAPLKYYDIALVKLNTKVTFTKYLHPACLWSKPELKDVQTKKFMVTGWGATEVAAKSVKLMKTQVDIFYGSKCDNLSNRNWNTSHNNHYLCAGNLDGSSDACTGDSGGPLQYKLIEMKNEGTMHMAVGVTSHGHYCALKDTPAAYTKISYFIDWIEENVWHENKSFGYNDS